MNIDSFLNVIPEGLRKPLLAEFTSITQNYLEHRWAPSELSGGRFCEIVYTILDGYSKSTYSTTPTKPNNFVGACKLLENHAHVPRSFQILIPRLLPALYEIRNNRNVGHVGGDVDPNVMDATAVIQIAGWIMGELVRVFHGVSIQEAEKAVSYLTERKIPLIWQSVEGIKRVLNPKVSIPDQILLLMSSVSGAANVEDVFIWLDYNNRGYFIKLLKEFHRKRFIEYSIARGTIELMPPGVKHLEGIIQRESGVI